MKERKGRGKRELSFVRPLKAPDSIETRLLCSRNKKEGKELEEGTNEGESEKEGRRGN